MTSAESVGMAGDRARDGAGGIDADRALIRAAGESGGGSGMVVGLGLMVGTFVGCPAIHSPPSPD